MSTDETAAWQPSSPGADTDSAARCLTLVLVGFPTDPTRVGEIARMPPGTHAVLGRHGTLEWIQQRPGAVRQRGMLTDPHLSRRQLELTATDSAIELTNLGRLPLKHNGMPIESASLAVGDVLQIADRVLLWVTQRPATLPGTVSARHRFGEADGQGILGESEAAWILRERVSFLARREQHTLVLGQSGTGKELVAQALHALSPRGSQPLVSRNAATIPGSLVDAELFGNIAGYPNPGMPGRAGMIGEADGSCLFLDEFGELPEEQQARLLRVMDAGEYAQLGDPRPQRADLRLIAATNRPAETLKHDVLARFPLRLQVPSLGDRREDIPLLAVHLLRSIAADDAEIAQRFFVDGHPNLDMDLVHHLLMHPYTTHVRELSTLLWQAITESTDGVLRVPRTPPGSTQPPTPTEIDPNLIDPAVIQAVLDRHNGRQEPAWRELGLSSRHVLARLVKKHGLDVRGRR